MRIAFVGLSAFSMACLEAVLEAGGEVVCVVTIDASLLPHHTDYVDLEPVAEAQGIPFFRVENVNEPEAVRRLRESDPDLLFVFGWSQLLKAELLAIPRRGTVGTHPQLLPQYRGRHQVQWTIALGHDCGGLTFFWIDEGMDTGDILWQEAFPIGLDDYAADVYERLVATAVRGIGEFMPRLLAGEEPRTPQQQELATYWPKRTDEDRVISWHEPSRKTYDLVRALSRPYIGALARLDGCDVLVWRAALWAGPLSPEHAAAPPGTILERRPDGVDVRTGDGYLTLVEVEPDIRSAGAESPR